MARAGRQAPRSRIVNLIVTSVPRGEAPLWVREKWVGLSLPLAQRGSAPRTYFTSGVLTGPRTFFSSLLALLTGKLERQTGFRIKARAAIEVLANSSPEAAAWWRENAPHETSSGRYFLFEEGIGHVEP